MESHQSDESSEQSVADDHDSKPKARAEVEGIEHPAASSATSPSQRSKTKPAKKKHKQFRAKKPKGMPRRPLSGYNIFFKEERGRLLLEKGEDSNTSLEDVDGKAKAKIGFEDMAKVIGKRWKELPEKDLARYKELANADMERYRREMDEYHLELSRQSRAERLQAQRLAAAPPDRFSEMKYDPANVAGLPSAQDYMSTLFQQGGNSLEGLLRGHQQPEAASVTQNALLEQQIMNSVYGQQGTNDLDAYRVLLAQQQQQQQQLSNLAMSHQSLLSNMDDSLRNDLLIQQYLAQGGLGLPGGGFDVSQRLLLARQLEQQQLLAQLQLGLHGAPGTSQQPTFGAPAAGLPAQAPSDLSDEEILRILRQNQGQR